MDFRLFSAVNRFAARTPWLHGVGRFVASQGITVFAILLLAAWWTARRSPRPAHGVAAAVWAGAAAPIALVINIPLAALVNRPRPFVTHSNVIMLVRHAADGGFPSDHSTAAGAVAVGLLLANRRLGIGASVAAILVALARVYVGVHYPGDVAAGLALGALVAFAGSFVARPIIERIINRGIGTRLAWLVGPSRSIST